jgi:hypothetical protein
MALVLICTDVEILAAGIGSVIWLNREIDSMKKVFSGRAPVTTSVSELYDCVDVIGATMKPEPIVTGCDRLFQMWKLRITG